MFRLFSISAALAALLLFVASIGIFWIASTAISQTKLDSVGASAKGVGLSIASQMDLMNQILDTMAQDEVTIGAMASSNPELIDRVAIRLANHLPNALNVRLLLPGITELDNTGSPPMSYADLNMVREAFAMNRNPMPAIQGDTTNNRHLAIARRIVHNGQTIGVILASFNEGWIRKSLLQTQISDGYIQLHQDKLLLASSGSRESGEDDTVLKTPVANTHWELNYGLNSSSMTLDSVLMMVFVAIPLVLLAVVFFFVYRRLSSLLREDLSSLMKAFKDMMKNNFQGDYPVRLTEMNGFISTLAQYKRISDRDENEVAATKLSSFEEDPGLSGLSLSFSDFNFDNLLDKKNNPDMPKNQSGDVFKKPADYIIFEDAPKAPASGIVLSQKANSIPVNTDVSHDTKDPIFRAYDIRGIVGKDLTQETVYDIGRALGTEAMANGCKTFVLGRDGRASSPELANALASGIITTGCSVLDIGRVPTPVLYFVAHHIEGRSGVMITGSHNPPEYNGIKMVIKGETLAQERIQNLKERIRSQSFRTSEPGMIENNDSFGNEYIGTVCEDIRIGRPMRVVVDCGNGVAGELAPMLLKSLGCETIELFCEIDGTFPNHHPDPSKPENLQELILAVKHYQADVGLAFDGDGDRLGVVDSNGKIIWPDRQMMLYAQNVLAEQPGSEIIFDVKCSRHLARHINKHGGRPLMWKTGHSLMKAKLRETGASLAGEMSGHIFFDDRWFGFDDALYTAARLIEILSGDRRTSAEVFAALPDSVSTPELNILLEEGENVRLLDEALRAAKFPGAAITTIDGLRVDFPDGFGLVRASNTTPSLVIRFEADTAEAMKRIQDQFKQLLKSIKSDITLPF